MGYYEVVATYSDADLDKKRELFLIEAETCSDAEYILLQYMAGFMELNVVSVKLTRVEEVYTDKSEEVYEPSDRRWYMCKMSETTFTDAGRKKKTAFYWALNADTTSSANTFLENELNAFGATYDWEINSISETKIVEFLQKDTQPRTQQ